MEPKLITLVTSLETLKQTIDTPVIAEAGFRQHGWNQVHLKQSDVSNFILNFINKLKTYDDNQLTENLDLNIDSYIDDINQLNAISKRYFTNNASHLIHSVPNILLTLHTIFSDIESELFSYENIQDKKLLPKALALRLRSTKTHLDSIDESTETLKEKIYAINDAHEAAESLPTDLASLKDAKKQLDNLIKSGTDELAATKKELEKIKDEMIVLKSSAEKYCSQTSVSSERASEFAEKASNLADKCDDAVQITTTQGLSAGFDQKANELKKSIWIWIIGLLIALVAGAVIGAQRVDAFTAVLSTELTAGQAILHTIMSVFSIGGPLWLAWISTQQINQRFKLAEDYSYKATVAKAFTGFKKFAERFDTATEERLFNSTLDRLDEMPLRLIEGKDYNSPWHEFTDSEAFKKAIMMVPSLAREVGRFKEKTDIKNKNKKKQVEVVEESETTPQNDSK